MTRVIVLCEGQSEQTFVNEVLRTALFERAGLDMRARLVGNPGRKGGNSWGKMSADLRLLLKGDRAAYCTTFFDFFRLPAAFPGMPVRQGLAPSERAAVVESALLAWASQFMGRDWDHAHFLPYVQMHEFEALCFSDPAAFARAVEQPDLVQPLRAIRDTFESPEHIDDGPETAPSRRILRLFPAYNKPLFGTLAALEMGLHTIRSACPHFNEWISRLEGLR